MSAVIGKTEDGQNLTLDIGRLVETRLLIEATSGGGKSYLNRVILEQTYGKIQQIVLDWEGEFASLREKFDYILAGKTGDIPADPRSAELLAKKILELGTSLIVDLYDLKRDQRSEFVRRFCDAMVNAPKELWHPVLIVIDEIHAYCPEKGESVAAGPVIDLITQGRKRGFCVIGATQRLSKFNKDGAAELINKLIGLTSLDIDRKRAGEELGFTEKAQLLSLRDLDAGVFYAFGPAISRHVVKAQVREALTTHPKAGAFQRMLTTVPPPTEKIRKQLVKLTDLPAEAEKELKTKEDMLTKIRDLKRENRELKTTQPKPKIDEKALDRQAKVSYQRGWKESATRHTAIITQLQKVARESTMKLSKIMQVLGKGDYSIIEMPKIELPSEMSISAFRKEWNTLPVQPKQIVGAIHNVKIEDTMMPGDVKFGEYELLILRFLSLESNVNRSFTKYQIGPLINRSAKSSSFDKALATLQRQGFISRQGDQVKITEDRLEEARELSNSIQLGTLQDWIGTLKDYDRKIYTVLYEHPDQTFSRQEIADTIGRSAKSSSFDKSVSHLTTLGLAEKDGAGIRFNQTIAEYL